MSSGPKRQVVSTDLGSDEIAIRDYGVTPLYVFAVNDLTANRHNEVEQV
ncbi:hypothetical protein GSF04_12435 [Pseudoalteromonas sp. A22]|nr:MULTISPECIES: hypothetical protein [Pseudoalteromonas]QUI63264.1 hypothetical protein GSF04_12435 [Pseudoalteromonas sp. A22]